MPVLIEPKRIGCVNVSQVASFDEVIAQLSRVAQTLDHTVHETVIGKVAQSGITGSAELVVPVRRVCRLHGCRRDMRGECFGVVGGYWEEYTEVWFKVEEGEGEG